MSVDLFDIEVIARADVLVARCKLCGGELKREGSTELANLVEAMTEHLRGNHS